MAAPVALVVVGLLALQAPKGVAPRPASADAAERARAAEKARGSTAEEVRKFVFDKLAYDRDYFSGVVEARRRGRRPAHLGEEAFASEVRRAQSNVPVLEKIAQERPKYDRGEPFTLPGGGHKEYRNLIGVLNMMQAANATDPARVMATGRRLVIDRPDDFGQVRGEAASFYVALYRQFFFLMAGAYFELGDDKAAIEWLSRLEEHDQLSALKAARGPEAVDPEKARIARRAQLRAAPVALLPPPPQDGTTSSTSGADWLGPALHEVLVTDLVNATDLVVVERSQLDKVYDELALSQSGFTDERLAQEAGKALGASTVFVARISAGPTAEGANAEGGKTSHVLSLRAVDAATEEILGAVTQTVSPDAPFADARRGLLALLDELGWSDAASADDLLARHAPDPGAAQKLERARTLVRKDPGAAKALYAEVIKSDPAAARMYEELKAEFKDVTALLAVMPILNLSGADDDAWRAVSVEQALAGDLPRLGFDVVERGRMVDVLSERAEKETSDPEAAQRIGKQLAADFVVLGSLLRSAPSVRIDVRFVDVRSGTVVFSTSVENRTDELPPLLTGLAEAIATHFHQKLDEKTLAELTGQALDKDALRKGATAAIARDMARVKAAAEADVPPIIDRFVVEPAEAEAGDTVRLRWEARRATSCRLRGLPDELPATGLVILTATSDAVHRLSCTGKGGEVAAEQALKIVGPGDGGDGIVAGLGWEPFVLWPAVAGVGVGTLGALAAFASGAWAWGLAHEYHGLQLATAAGEARTALQGMRDNWAGGAVALFVVGGVFAAAATGSAAAVATVAVVGGGDDE